MDKQFDIIQEIVEYEQNSQFKFHINILASSYPMHWHNAVEIVMPIQNTYTVGINNQQYKLNEHDILIIPSGELHEMRTPATEGQRIILQFGHEILNAVRGLTNASHTYMNLWLITEKSDPKLHAGIEALLLEMLDEYLTRDIYFEIAIRHKIVAVTLLLIRSRQMQSFDNSSYDINTRKGRVERLNECIEYINNNYSERLTLDSVAHAIGFSKYHFSRWFAESMGMQFHDYLAKTRIERAEAILTGSTRTIMEIAMETGFQSTNTFNRAFKKFKNCTPTHYRHRSYIKQQTSDTQSAKTTIVPSAIKMKPPSPLVCSEEFYSPCHSEHSPCHSEHSPCHSERSEESYTSKKKILRFAQDDRSNAQDDRSNAQDDNSLELSQGQELLLNNCFEEGIEHWGVMEAAEIEMTEDNIYDHAPVLKVTQRITTASGPRQMITGKLKHGGIYSAYAIAKYTDGPERKTFNICFRNGTTWEGIRAIGSGTLVKGEWGILRGTYTVAGDADLTESSVFLETPWSSRPEKEKDLMDFYVSCVSVTDIPAPSRPKTETGEATEITARLQFDLPWQYRDRWGSNQWTVSERPGFLRLKTSCLSRGFPDAEYTLVPEILETCKHDCAVTIALETIGMKDGDAAGLAIMQERHGYIGVKVVNGERYIIVVNTASNKMHDEMTPPHMLAGVNSFAHIKQQRVYLRIDIGRGIVGTDTLSARGRILNAPLQQANKGNATYRFYYSLDEINWYAIGDPLPLKTLTRTGKRQAAADCNAALFYYATQMAGGHADFDYIRFSDEPVRHNESLAVLGASLKCDEQVPGISNVTVRASIHLDELPEDKANPIKGIHMSFHIHPALEVKGVEFITENITGNAGYRTQDDRLSIEVTGDSVSFAHNGSDKFAEVSFSVKYSVEEDITAELRPDYIYIKGGNAAYRTHNINAAVHILKQTGIGIK